MALNQTLGLARAMFKAESAKSLAAATTAQDAEINQIIADRQQWLASNFDWPFLEERWDVSAGAGTRYVAMPTTDNSGTVIAIDLQRTFKMEIKWNRTWQPVVYGIGSEEYNYLDSDTGQVLDPVQRFRYEGTSEFEIWPLPASPQTLRITGQRVLNPLFSGATTPPTWDDTKTLDLDDLMVVYFAVAYYLAREKQANAKLMLDTATNRMNEIRASYPKREKMIRIGGQQMGRRDMRIVPMVVVGN